MGPELRSVPPTTLTVNGGKASVSKATRLSATQHKFTIKFTFTVGNDGYAWLWNECSKDAGRYSRAMSTVTVWPPGLIVSGSSMAASPATVTVIVTLWPASRVPDDCERLTSASSWDGAETDQVTGPPFAVSVNEPLPPTARAMLLVDTLSVPAVVAGGEEVDPPEVPPLCGPEGDDDPEVDPPEGDAVTVLPVGEALPPETLMAELPEVGIEDGVGEGASRRGCGATSLP